ncbi:MAG: minor capsid protein [Bacillota bacterium]|nr:minor capsid protein [Bacillota bacterium]
MAMKARNYWQKRFEMLEEAQLKTGQAYYSEAEKQFTRAAANVEKEISNWYRRFAENNEISLLEAKRLLNSSQLKELKWDIEEYIKYGKENALDQRWMKELENASAKAHITRLEALKLQIQQQAEVLFGNQVDGIDELARKIYSDGYYHTAYEIQRGFNVGWDLQPLNEKQVSAVVSKPWTADNKTFKDRCWTNKQQLVNTVHTELTQAIIRGDAPTKAINRISNQFTVSKNKAGRLIMTESAFFASKSQQDCFNDLDVEKYQLVATLDLRTSEICEDLDGQVFAMKDYEIGLTAPPFHPWCRTVTVPYFEDDYGERAARDSEGKTYDVPSDMTYKDWKKSFASKVDEREKLDIIESYRTNNIHIIENGDISVKTLSDIKKASDTVTKDFPGLNGFVSDISFGDLNGAVAENRFSIDRTGKVTDSVVLDSGCFSDTKGTMQVLHDHYTEGISYQTENIGSLVAHELGHAAHQLLALNRAGYVNGKNLSSIQVSIFQSERKKISQEIYLQAFTDESFEEIFHKIYNELGQRASESGEELIAQSFGNYYFGKHKSKVAKSIVKFFMKGFS